MECNCIKDLEKSLLEQVKNSDKFKDIIDEVNVSAQNMAFIFGEHGKANLQPYMEFLAEAHYKTKGGNIRRRKETLNVTHKYCPFCGEKLIK